MTQSEFLYDYQVTNRRGINYFIGVRADPDLNQVESFAAILFFRLVEVDALSALDEPLLADEIFVGALEDAITGLKLAIAGELPADINDSDE